MRAIYGHALGRVAAAVGKDPQRRAAFACIEEGIGDLYAALALVPGNTLQDSVRLEQEVRHAAMGIFDSEVAQETGVTATSPADVVFGGAPVSSTSPAPATTSTASGTSTPTASAGAQPTEERPGYIGIGPVSLDECRKACEALYPAEECQKAEPTHFSHDMDDMCHLQCASSGLDNPTNPALNATGWSLKVTTGPSTNTCYRKPYKFSLGEKQNSPGHFWSRMLGFPGVNSDDVKWCLSLRGKTFNLFGAHKSSVGPIVITAKATFNDQPDTNPTGAGSGTFRLAYPEGHTYVKCTGKYEFKLSP